MEWTPRRLLVVAFALAIVIGAGVYARAQLRMLDTLTATRDEIDSIGYDRGGRMPSAERVREQVEAIAAARHVELSGLEVIASEEAGLGGVQGFIGHVVQGRTRVFTVTALATAHELGLDRQEAFDVRIALRIEATVAPTPGRPALDAETVDPAGPARRGL